MREQIKQLLKNSVYRAIGETANGIGAVNGDGRTLRVLMYHKVNDLPGNRMSMPVSTLRRADGAAEGARLHRSSISTP